MKKYTQLSLLLFCLILILGNLKLKAQTCEWRYGKETYSSADPDGAGPATGIVTFTLQLHTISGTIVNASAIGTGFAYQSSKLMLPTPVICFTPGIQPSNITMSPAFLSAGFTYNTVNFCNDIDPAEITGGQGFDKRASGTVDAAVGTNITTAWQDVFTVTMWTLGSSFPQGGYVMINAGFDGLPTPIVSNWSVATATNEYYVNSPNYNTPLALGGALPVLFSKFEAKCANTGTLISWATAQEGNSSRFEVERSTNGTNWTNIGTVQAAGNSNSDRSYQQLDLNAGTAFYRIKQVDKDGQFIYTDIERTNCQVKNISSIIYPVPAFDVLNVVIKSDRSVRTQLLVYDMQGKMVKKVDASILSGNNTFKINLIGLASGDYMLRSNDATIELNKLFTISR